MLAVEMGLNLHFVLFQHERRYGMLGCGQARTRGEGLCPEGRGGGKATAGRMMSFGGTEGLSGECSLETRETAERSRTAGRVGALLSLLHSPPAEKTTH